MVLYEEIIPMELYEEIIPLIYTFDKISGDHLYPL